MKRIRLFIPIFAALIWLLSAVTVRAIEPAYVTLGFSNSGGTALQIIITDTTAQTTETIQIPANQTIQRTFALSEPGVTELLVENTDPNSTDPAYYVWLYAEIDETGALRGYAVSQIAGTEDKPAELVFGVTNPDPDDPDDPEEPDEPETPEKPTKPKPGPSSDDPAESTHSDTGDHANMVLWAVIGAGFAIVLLCLVVFLLRRNRKKDGENE